MLGKLLTLPVSAPLGGVAWLAAKVREAVMAGALDPGRVEAAMRKLERRLDAGEITEDEYDAAEEALLAELREIRAALAEQARLRAGGAP
jgi:multidrug resistance efflux pump